MPAIRIPAATPPMGPHPASRRGHCSKVERSEWLPWLGLPWIEPHLASVAQAQAGALRRAAKPCRQGRTGRAGLPPDTPRRTVPPKRYCRPKVPCPSQSGRPHSNRSRSNEPLQTPCEPGRPGTREPIAETDPGKFRRTRRRGRSIVRLRQSDAEGVFVNMKRPHAGEPAEGAGVCRPAQYRLLCHRLQCHRQQCHRQQCHRLLCRLRCSLQLPSADGSFG